MKLGGGTYDYSVVYVYARRRILNLKVYQRPNSCLGTNSILKDHIIIDYINTIKAGECTHRGNILQNIACIPEKPASNIKEYLSNPKM